MVRALEADLVALRSRPSAAPGQQPPITPVEIPKPEKNAPPAAAAPPPAPPVPPTPARPRVPETPPAAERKAESFGAPVSEVAESTKEPAGEPTASVDVRAILDQQLSPTMSTPPPAAPPAPATPPAPPKPAARESEAIDLDDAVDAEVLDDDAFFATLREAVHDESPLGPRDDAMSFFDDEEDADRGSFFRRRR
jgi:hypothetical protein